MELIEVKTSAKSLAKSSLAKTFFVLSTLCGSVAGASLIQPPFPAGYHQFLASHNMKDVEYAVKFYVREVAREEEREIEAREMEMSIETGLGRRGSVDRSMERRGSIGSIGSIGSLDRSLNIEKLLEEKRHAEKRRLSAYEILCMHLFNVRNGASLNIPERERLGGCPYRSKTAPDNASLLILRCREEKDRLPVLFTELNLSGFRLSCLPVEGLAVFTNVIRLNLTGTGLMHGFDKLAVLPNLEELILNHNGLRDFPLLNMLPHLRYLSVVGSDFGYLDFNLYYNTTTGTFYTLEKLRTLDITNCGITWTQNLKRVMPGVKEVYYGANSIYSIDPTEGEEESRRRGSLFGKTSSLFTCENGLFGKSNNLLGKEKTMLVSEHSLFSSESNPFVSRRSMR